MHNVIIYAPISRRELLNVYKYADILLLNLSDIECFNIVIPSKIFEYSKNHIESRLKEKNVSINGE